MITLATYDIVYNFIRPELVEVYKKGYHFYAGHKVVPVIQVDLRGPVYCTIAISIERYLTVCHSFVIAGKMWSAKIYIIPIIVFLYCINHHIFFEMAKHVATQDN